MDLMKRLQLMIQSYITKYLAAPVKWGQRCFGVQLPTKSDVRRGFLQDLKMIAEIAQLEGNTAVLNKIKCVVDDNFEQDIAAIKKITDTAK